MGSMAFLISITFVLSVKTLSVSNGTDRVLEPFIEAVELIFQQGISLSIMTMHNFLLLSMLIRYQQIGAIIE